MEKHVMGNFRDHNRYMHETAQLPIARNLEEAGRMELKNGQHTSLALLLTRPDVNK